MSLTANSLARAQCAQAMATIVRVQNERLESILSEHFPPLDRDPLWRDDRDDLFDQGFFNDDLRRLA